MRLNQQDIQYNHIYLLFCLVTVNDAAGMRIRVKISNRNPSCKIIYHANADKMH